MSHPLSTPWSIYAFLNDGEENGADYESQLKRLGYFDNVEDFWRIFSHIQPTTSFKLGWSIHLFKNGTRAMREDPEHLNGGSYLVRVSKKLSSYYWEKLVLAMIGGQLRTSVIGAILSSKPKYDNISIWHQDIGNSDEERKALCEEFSNILGLPVGIRVDYTSHESVISKSPESRKNAVHYTLKEDCVESYTPNRFR